MVENPEATGFCSKRLQRIDNFAIFAIDRSYQSELESEFDSSTESAGVASGEPLDVFPVRYGLGFSPLREDFDECYLDPEERHSTPHFKVSIAIEC